MVADGQGVVAHGIHDEHHGVDGESASGDFDAGGETARLFEGLIDPFERSALDGVAGIDEESIGGLFADFADESGDFGEAEVGGLLAEVVVGVDVAVEVGGGKDGDLGGLSVKGEGEED